MPGRGLWAAGAAATRALVHAAAQEHREHGVHVALLIVDATIDSPKTAAMIAGKAPEETADQAEIARAVEYLAGQSPRAYTHELVVTPAGDRWLPELHRADRVGRCRGLAASAVEPRRVDGARPSVLDHPRCNARDSSTACVSERREHSIAAVEVRRWIVYRARSGRTSDWRALSHRSASGTC